MWSAWYVPEHFVLDLSSPFFVHRFRQMSWTIFTPDSTAYWNTKQLEFGPGIKAGISFQGADKVEELWRTFYKALNCPERNNPKAMTSRMPKKLWPLLPELNGKT
jgi:DNA polymerase